MFYIYIYLWNLEQKNLISSWQVPTDTEPLEEEFDPWEMAGFPWQVAMAMVDKQLRHVESGLVL